MVKWRKILSLMIGVLLILLLASCNMPKGDNDLTDVEILKTAARQTVEAKLTENVDGPEEGSLTPSPTEEQEDPGEEEPTPSPTLTTEPPPPASDTPEPCNRMQFVDDVTIPDGTDIVAGDSFTKTWRLKNTGTCAWTSGYQLIFDHGDRMDAPDTAPVTSGSVGSGNTVDVSADLTAPDTPGTYQGYFLLRSPDGVVFGLGGGQGFWVKIEVIAEATATPTNTATATATNTTAPQPDLIINQIEFNPDPPVSGSPVDVSVQVYNQGDAVAVGPFTVEWYPGESFTDPGCDLDTVSNLSPSDDEVLTCNYSGYPDSGDINTKAIADTTDTVDESDETNNEMLKAISVDSP